MVQHEESAEQAAAFEAYYARGRDRSLEKLSQTYTKLIPDSKKTPSLITLKNWSRWFHWQERIAIKDKAVATGLDKQTTKAAINRRAKWLARVEARIDSAFDKEGNPKFEIEEYKDLNETIKLALALLGEPEKREVEQRGEIKIIRVKDL